MNDDDKALVCNGEFGEVVAVFPTKTIVRLRKPDRLIVIPRGKGEDSGTESGSGCDMDLGYAASVHKMQGSSAPIIIGVLDEYPGATGTHGICDRAWVFTLISRAELVCYLVGRQSTLVDVCRRQYIKKRKTFMSELLGRELQRRTQQAAPQPQEAAP